MKPPCRKQAASGWARMLIPAYTGHKLTFCVLHFRLLSNRTLRPRANPSVVLLPQSRTPCTQDSTPRSPATSSRYAVADCQSSIFVVTVVRKRVCTWHAQGHFMQVAASMVLFVWSVCSPLCSCFSLSRTPSSVFSQHYEDCGPMHNNCDGGSYMDEDYNTPGWY